ncbi:hypothetical protein MLD38_018845 [Melastoma candidum]|uniref:Uncharacterized protein n=1 Tax=Melastoma candidum TaxID=119954 RepID=A0ACB9QV63_9MYRT|nr:hypothetical protein MLD38_018845 [Melastoma candidum]
MENLDDGCDRYELAPGSSPARNSQYRLCGRQSTVRQCMGGGLDVLLWKRRHVSFGLIVATTVAWVIFERQISQFIETDHYQNYQSWSSQKIWSQMPLSFRVKINSLLLTAHDITLGKDFRLFFKVVICLWLLSVVGSYFSFFSLAYIGTLLSITIPALYSKHEAPVDKCFSLLHRKFSHHYKIVNENFNSKLPRSLAKNKNT